MRQNSFKYFRRSCIYMIVRRLPILLAVFLGLVATATTSLATTTKVRLILPVEAARPGDTLMAGISLEMQPHWHTYWKNPGDSGLAATVQWTLPPGVTAGDIQWPVPEKLVTPPLTTYGYSGQAILLVPLTIASN